MKRMLTTDELIAHMKAKGITFQHISEEEAKTFLICLQFPGSRSYEKKAI